MAGRGGSNTTEKGGPQHYCLGMSTYEGIKNGTGEGNRTPANGFGDRYATITQHPYENWCK